MKTIESQTASDTHASSAPDGEAAGANTAVESIADLPPPSHTNPIVESQATTDTQPRCAPDGEPEEAPEDLTSVIAMPPPARKATRKRSSQSHDDAQAALATAGGEAQQSTDTQARTDLAAIVSEIRHLHRTRCDLMNAERALANQVGAIERRLAGHDAVDTHNHHAGQDEDGEAQHRLDTHDRHGLAVLAVPQIFAALDIITAGRKEPEKLMRKLAQTLPVWPWAAAVNGFGPLGLAQIVAECGDLALYANPAKVWRRFGLDVQKGAAPKRTKGEKSSFSPRRRAIAYNIGESLIKKQSAYRDMYLERKEYEAQRAEASGLTVAPAAKIPAKRKAEFMSLGHIHARARRYAVKALLRDLWTAWRAT